MKSLIIWLPTRQTMKFEDVRDFDEEPIRYDELAVRWNAVFRKDIIMGWALEQDEE